MLDQVTTLIVLIPPVSLLLFSFWAAFVRKGSTPKAGLVAEYLGWLGILVSASCALLLLAYGVSQSGLLGLNGFGFSLRLDPLSVIMLNMISILGFVVMRFSRNYLDGDSRKPVFLARLSATIASVQLLVLSGNLGQLLFFWIITSVCLHYLLVFYRNRPQAIAAARKKFIAARLGDLSLAGAVALIYSNTGTGDLQAILEMVQLDGFMNGAMIFATVLLVVTAAFKSAQFPTHGWLLEVVETPTPVSALLHAGLLNAGPFLMVRMSFLMNESSLASLLLIGIGGFTAMFASLVYLTQPSVKVGLGYSSIAHMGFSLLICGFGVYSAALLHVVAHSFYKAHSFLSSGSAVDLLRARKISTPKKSGSLWSIGFSLLVALAVYAAFCQFWGLELKTDFNLILAGSIVVLGLSQILTSSLNSKGSLKLILRSAGLSLAVTLSFFTLEHISRIALASEIPFLQEASTFIKIAEGTVVFFFLLIVLIQQLAPRLKSGQFGYVLGVHLRNGFYANVLFDRLIGSLHDEKFKWANLSVEEEAQEEENLIQESPSYSQAS